MCLVPSSSAHFRLEQAALMLHETCSQRNISATVVPNPEYIDLVPFLMPV